MPTETGSRGTRDSADANDERADVPSRTSSDASGRSRQRQGSDQTAQSKARRRQEPADPGLRRRTRPSDTGMSKRTSASDTGQRRKPDRTARDPPKRLLAPLA